MNVETLYVLRLKKPGNLSCLALKFERLIYDYVPAIQHAHIPHSTNCLLSAYTECLLVSVKGTHNHSTRIAHHLNKQNTHRLSRIVLEGLFYTSHRRSLHEQYSHFRYHMTSNPHRFLDLVHSASYSAEALHSSHSP